MRLHSASGSAALYIVATPIGNLADISQRAIQTLSSVSMILAEDTRHSGILLSHLGIKKPLKSFHAHNEAGLVAEIILALQQGQAIALISDAGTPLISDPGYSLVQQARAQGIAVIPIPGPCALITALSAAGVPCDNFSFFGFLPAKPKARREKLELVKQLGNTVIFYESTHRIHACIDDMSAIFGEDSPLVLAKELTKTFEQFVSGPLSSIKLWLNADLGHVKGEFVLIIPPRTLAPTTDSSTRILKLLLAELPLKQAVSLATEISGGNKNMLYQEALALTEQLKKHGGLD